MDAAKQRKSPSGKKPTPASWKPGQGNPAGRPADREYREAIALLKSKWPQLMAKAIDMALVDGSEKVMVVLSKICPDKLDLGGELGDSLSAIAAAILVKNGTVDPVE